MLEQYITTKEASQLLGVARRTVTKWCLNEKLPFVQKLGWIWLINKTKLLKWLEENEKDMNPVYKLPRYKKIEEEVKQSVGYHRRRVENKQF